MNYSMPESAKNLILSLHADNLSPQEIADATDIPVTAVINTINALTQSSTHSVTITKSDSPKSEIIATKAADVTILILDKISVVAQYETDSAKLASLLRAVSALADSNKIQTSITTTLAKLR